MGVRMGGRREDTGDVLRDMKRQKMTEMNRGGCLMEVQFPSECLLHPKRLRLLEQVLEINHDKKEVAVDETTFIAQVRLPLKDGPFDQEAQDQLLEFVVDVITVSCTDVDDLYYNANFIKDPILHRNPSLERRTLQRANSLLAEFDSPIARVLKEGLKKRIDNFFSTANAATTFKPATWNNVSICDETSDGTPKQLNYLHQNVVVGERENEGRGIFAKSSVPADEKICQIPADGLLSIWSVMKDKRFAPLARGLLEDGAHQDAVLLVYIALQKRIHEACREQQNGICQDDGREVVELDTDSPLGFLCNTVGLSETDFTTACSLPHEVLHALGDESILEKVKQNNHILWNTIKAVRFVLDRPEYRDCCPVKITFDDFKFAKNVCDTRGFSVHMEPPLDLTTEDINATKDVVSPCTCIAPVADFLNHSPYAQCARPQFNEETKMLEISTICDVSAGAQVYLNYAPQGSASMLTYYGFVQENNPFEQVEIEFDEPDELDYTLAKAMQNLVSTHILRGLNITDPLPSPLVEFLLAYVNSELGEEEVDFESKKCIAANALTDAIISSNYKELADYLGENWGDDAWWRPQYGHIVDAYRAERQRVINMNLARLEFWKSEEQEEDTGDVEVDHDAARQALLTALAEMSDDPEDGEGSGCEAEEPEGMVVIEEP